jgi:hypothetical protein
MLTKRAPRRNPGDTSEGEKERERRGRKEVLKKVVSECDI